MNINGRDHTQAELTAALEAQAAIAATGFDASLIPGETLVYFVHQGYSIERIVRVVLNQPEPSTAGTVA